MGNGLEGVGLKQWSQLVVTLFPKGHFSMSGGNLACYHLEVFPGIWCTGARNAATHLSMQGTTPPFKKNSVPNANSAEVEKAWCEMRRSLESTQDCKFTEIATEMYRENIFA